MMKIRKFLSILWGELIGVFTRCLCLFYTPHSQIILMGEWAGQCKFDNPYHLFIFFRKRGLNCYFITNDAKKFDDEHIITPWSLKSIWVSINCTHAFYSHDLHDLNPYLLNRKCKKYNLWHGIGPKKLAFDNKYSKLYYPSTLIEKGKAFIFRRKLILPDYFISPSEVFNEFYQTAFALRAEQLVNLPYPRNIARDRMHEKAQKHSDKVLYAPTLRTGAQLKSLENFLVSFGRNLAENGLKLCVRLHPVNQGKLVSSDEYDIEEALDVHPQSYRFFVSDYSSIIWDWQAMGLNYIIVNLDDWDFANSEREMYFKLSDCVEHILTSNADIVSWLAAWRTGKAHFAKIDKAWAYPDVNDEDEIVNAYLKLVTTHTGHHLGE